MILKRRGFMRYTSLMLLTIVAPFCSASNDYEKAHDAFNASKVEEAYIHLKNSLKNIILNSTVM